ncbi:MAG: MCE family protein [Verrucomicrobia bacterium]|nr:MCE family protein [Verrucomicrobiota bacterium]
MSQSRIEWKVGGFVAVGLVLLALLVLNFSKGLSLLKPSYGVRLKTTSVGGIKEKAAVLLAGVTVGNVTHVELAPDSKSVIIFLRIYSRHDIPGDAVFNIEAQGFLGDQYVSIAPTQNALPPLPKDGSAQRECRAPFNIQDAARDALGLIQRLDLAAQKIDIAVERVNKNVLSEATLTNFAAMVASFRVVAEQSRTVTERAIALEDKAHGTLDRVDGLLVTNTAPIQLAVSNVLRFSEQLNKVGADLQDTVGSNRSSIQAAVRNLETASAQVTNLLGEVQSGRGLAGALFKDEVMASNFKRLFADLPAISGQVNSAVSNVNALTLDAHLVMTNLNSFLGDGRLLASNGAMLMSNLNAHGLFYKPKPPKPTNSVPTLPLLSPRQKANQQ